MKCTYSLLCNFLEGPTYCNEIVIMIAQAKVRVLRGITVVFECMLAHVQRQRDGYVANTECAMYS